MVFDVLKPSLTAIPKQLESKVLPNLKFIFFVYKKPGLNFGYWRILSKRVDNILRLLGVNFNKFGFIIAEKIS